MNCIITGGTRGVGRYISTGLLALNHRVIAIARTQESADTFKDELLASHSDSSVFVCDVTDYYSVEKTMGMIHKKYGHTDAVVNCAGISGPSQLIGETNPSEWDECIRVNLLGVYNCTRAILPQFTCKGSGRIINIVSSHCMTKLRNVSAYSISKIGVMRFTELLHLEYSPCGIFAFAVHPGTIETDMTRALGALAMEGSPVFPGLSRRITEGNMDEPFSAMQLIGEIAEGKHDALSGKYLQAKYNMEYIEGKMEGIKDNNLLEIHIKTIIV